MTMLGKRAIAMPGTVRAVADNPVRTAPANGPGVAFPGWGRRRHLVVSSDPGDLQAIAAAVNRQKSAATTGPAR
jgi:hypothetical protein